MLESSKDWKLEFNTLSKSTPIEMWHGNQDHEVPLPASVFLQSLLNNDTNGQKDTENRSVPLHIIEGESHSLIRRHWSTILKTTIQNATVTSSRY